MSFDKEKLYWQNCKNTCRDSLETRKPAVFNYKQIKPGLAQLFMMTEMKREPSQHKTKYKKGTFSPLSIITLKRKTSFLIIKQNQMRGKCI